MVSVFLRFCPASQNEITLVVLYHQQHQQQHQEQKRRWRNHKKCLWYECGKGALKQSTMWILHTQNMLEKTTLTGHITYIVDTRFLMFIFSLFISTEAFSTAAASKQIVTRKCKIKWMLPKKRLVRAVQPLVERSSVKEDEVKREIYTHKGKEWRWRMN